MLLVAESLLEKILKESLKRFKQTPDIIDEVFRHFNPEVVSRFKQSLVSDKDNIVITMGFPRPNTHIPTYCIMLGGEQEQVEGIGNVQDEEIGQSDDTLSVNAELSADGTITIFSPIYSVTGVSYSGVPVDEFVLVDKDKGIVRVIDSAYVEGDVLTLEYKPSIASGNGATLFRSQYRVESWSNNGDMVVCMYHLAKTMLLQNKYQFLQEGILQMSLSGADFEPMPQYMPEFVYRRALIIDLTDEMSWDIEGYGIDEGSVISELDND